MFIRALSIALCCAYATALAPLTPAADDNDCALYLTGPGRSSAYDYSLNLLKGNFGYEGQHTCITYDAINQAYLEARNRIVVSQPKGDWKAEDFASVGELILDISINLARKYGLTYEEIEKGLPLIDTSRTLIREVCPPVFSHVECRAGKYRRLDGLCNNLQHPTWGATMAPFQRLIGPLFADGINAPRISHTGRDLPLSRVVSRTMHPDEGFHDHAGTVMVIAWGQFMDHDYTLTGTPLDPVNRNDPEECCKRPLHLKHPYCNEILVPEDDYFYRLFGVKCIDFVRGFPSPRPGCRLGSRVPFNTLTGALDGNTVYGVTEKFARKLRKGYGGLLRMNPVFKDYGLRDLLPLKLDIPDEGCTRPNKNMYCFEAGEIRVNEQLVLTVMHTLMAREHNRVAGALAEVNPHWDDETLFQEARRINIAEIQHITYNEFLPILLGKDVMEKFGLVLEKEGYWDGYDTEVNPDVLDSFAAAAYRFGHSLLPTAVERWSKAHKFIASKRLSDLIRRPYDLYRAGVLDEYVMGLMNQVAQAMDDSITQEVTNHLFKKVGARFGMDLVSFNMQRGREFGLPGYMEFRKFCGLPGAESFQDLFGTMSNETVRKFESIFEHPIDVDLWSGGVSERPLAGSMLGPTFACIIATQFSYSRRGDRFWYELPNQPSTFTPEQLLEIRKARLARIICDNTDIIDTVQLYPMVLPDHELNPRVPCRSGIIPSMDFTKWAEPAPFRGAAKQFITIAQAFRYNETNCVNAPATLPTLTTTANHANVKSPSSDNDTDCNFPADIQPIQSSNLFTLQISFNRTSSKQNNNTTQGANSNTQNLNTQTADCEDNVSISNEIPNSDTVLKYVYKTNDKNNVPEKTKSHRLNSIRKKRSLTDKHKIENITVDESQNAPLILNYETSHDKKVLREPEITIPVYQRLTENTVQNSALADFNIETLHDAKSLSQGTKPINENISESSKSSENIKDEDKLNKDASPENSSGSSETDNNSRSEEKNNEHQSKAKSSQEIDESSEEDSYESQEREQSIESDESNENKDHYRKNREYRTRTPSRQSIKNDDKFYRPAHLETQERDESLENNKYYKNNNEDYIRTPTRRSDKRNTNRSHQRPSYIQAPESDESFENKDFKISNNYKENFRHTPTRQSSIRNDDKTPAQTSESEESFENKENNNYKKDFRRAPTRQNIIKDDDKAPVQTSQSDESVESRERYRGDSLAKNNNFEDSNEKSKTFSENPDETSNDKDVHGRKDSYYKNPLKTDDEYNESIESSERYRPIQTKENKQYNEKLLSADKHKSVSPEYEDSSINSKVHVVQNNRKDYEGRKAVQKVEPGEHVNNDDFTEQDNNFKVENKNSQEEGPYKNTLSNLKNNLNSKHSENIASTTPTIQDVDLGDFSFERIQVNDKGQIIPDNENDDTETLNPSLKHSPLETHSKQIVEKTLSSIEDSSEPVKESSHESHKEPININDGEIKPVVEINTDSNEENYKEDIKSDTPVTSLESILGTEEADTKKDSDKKIITSSDEDSKADVKQEFERIPLNYNHDIKKEDTSDKPNKEEISNTNDGTLDTITPKNDNYDEHLRFKFDDISIKLPDIKLPKDILSYEYEVPQYNTKDDIRKDRKKNYQYDNEEKENIKKDDEDDDDFDKYYGYYGNKPKKDNYKKRNGEHDSTEDPNDDVDLYEKFVRERFGKKGSFQQRAENLEDGRITPKNEKLYDTVKNLLKQTQEIKKQAEKSGDPNAGYMWTLEYGENL